MLGTRSQLHVDSSTLTSAGCERADLKGVISLTVECMDLAQMLPPIIFLLNVFSPTSFPHRVQRLHRREASGISFFFSFPFSLGRSKLGDLPRGGNLGRALRRHIGTCERCFSGHWTRAGALLRRPFSSVLEICLSVACLVVFAQKIAFSFCLEDTPVNWLIRQYHNGDEVMSLPIARLTGRICPGGRRTLTLDSL